LKENKGMDATKLKQLTIAKLSEEIPLANINEPLVDKLVGEFCEKNQQEFAKLNTFTFSDERLKEIKANLDKAITDGTIERIEYEQAINHAGVAYLSSKVCEYIAELPDADFVRKTIE
jgi:hypothetical protein